MLTPGLRVVTGLVLIASLGFTDMTLNHSRAEGDELWGAITDGEFKVNLRYRFEHVDDDFRPGGIPLKDANASTLRTAVSYQSGSFYNFSTFLELEQVSRIFGGEFNEGLGAPSRYATVVDPDGTELNQGYLQYVAPWANQIRLGRQAITYREAPFHRFIGNILWRQNWQTFDAASLSNTYFSNTRLSYAYVWNVNRIFGSSAVEPLSNFDSDSHFINLQNRHFQWAQLEGYAYLLDFDKAARFSSRTLGVRLYGEYPLNDWFTPIYTLEYADQSDYAENTTDYDADYQLLEAGFKIKPPKLLDSFMFKFSYERLSGDGSLNGSFVTILGTNHAFQGTADRFLITPNDGIRDYYVTSVMTAYGFTFNISYHMIQSDHLDYDYGNELDMELSRPFGKYLTFGLKYADYDADGNTINRLRNGAEAFDTRKIWFYTLVRF
jgi:hypothetical protein